MIPALRWWEKFVAAAYAGLIGLGLWLAIGVNGESMERIEERQIVNTANIAKAAADAAETHRLIRLLYGATARPAETQPAR